MGVLNVYDKANNKYVPVASNVAVDYVNSADYSNDKNSFQSQLNDIVQQKSYLNKWFAGGIKGKKIIIVGDSTSELSFGLYRALSYYQRRGGELEGTAILNYGSNGQTLSGWNSDSGRYGKTSTIAQQADLYIFDYGINDCRQSALTEDQFVTLLEQAITDIQTGSPNSTILLRMPNTFTTSDTGAYGFISPETPASAQSLSTLLRNAYIRASKDKGVALLDTQALVFGLTSQADTQSPYMLNQIHASDLGNYAIAREMVKMIGVPPTIPPVIFSMSGKVGIGIIGTRTLAKGGTFKLGYMSCKPSLSGGTLTVEIRKVATDTTETVLGTITYTGGTASGNTVTPQSQLLDDITLLAGESIKVSVTACTVDTYDLKIYTIMDENPKVSIYPLQLRGSGLVSSLDGSVVYSATQGLPSTMERDIKGLKAITIKKLNTNRFTSWSQDATQSAWVTGNVNITGNAGNQTFTATTTNSYAALRAPVTGGETLTFSWRGTYTGTPQFAVYDETHGTFIVSSTNWGVADGNGWRSITFTVPTGCSWIRGYALSHSANINDTVTITGMQLSVGSSMTTFVPTNKIGTSLVVNTGALPSEFTIINFVKVDATTDIGVVSPGVNTDGNPALQVANGNRFGYPAISTRGTVTQGANGTWQSSVLRATGGNVFTTINDQAPSTAFAKAVNRTILSWNLLNDSDTSGSWQNWDGEVMAFYFPYLLSEGEATSFVRSILRKLQAAGETITADWSANRLV